MKRTLAIQSRLLHIIITSHLLDINSCLVHRGALGPSELLTAPCHAEGVVQPLS